MGDKPEPQARTHVQGPRGDVSGNQGQGARGEAGHDHYRVLGREAHIPEFTAQPPPQGSGDRLDGLAEAVHHIAEHPATHQRVNNLSAPLTI